jgi:hypothetical protein
MKRVMLIVSAVLIILLAVLFIFSTQEIYGMLALGLIVIIIIGNVCVITFTAHSLPNRFLKTLHRIERAAVQEAASALHELYMDLYNIYLRLSEKHKVNVYPRLMKLRETLETNMKNEKRVELLLSKWREGSVRQRHAMLLELQQLFKVLPKKVHDFHYPGFVHFKESLDKG